MIILMFSIRFPARLPFKIYMTTSFTKGGSEPDPYWTPNTTDIPSGNYNFAIIFFHFHICFIGYQTYTIYYLSEGDSFNSQTANTVYGNGGLDTSRTYVTNTTRIYRGASAFAFAHSEAIVPLIGIYFV